MNTSAPPTPRPGAGPVRPNGSLAISEPPPPSRRSWVWAAVCGCVAVLAMLAVISVVNSVNDRDPVLAVGRDVKAGQKLAAEDLVVAEVADDAALKPVSAHQRRSLVGQYATVELRAGTLLTGSQVSPTDRVSAGKQLVGVAAKRGRLPARALVPGDRVKVVSTPGEGEEPAPGQGGVPSAIDGTVKSLSAPDASGTVVVNLAVSPVDGLTLAERAAGGDVAIVMEPRS